MKIFIEYFQKKDNADRIISELSETDPKFKETVENFKYLDEVYLYIYIYILHL